MRRVIPYTVLPLALIAGIMASSPWLRAFPSDVIAVPLFGAAVLSILAPLIVVGIGVRRLWISALVDVALFVFYELLVTLRTITGFDDLWNGLVHGPSEILSFALPLVSPRTLLVAPIALCWLAGAVLGECVARSWHSVVPYIVVLVTFGLAYAGTVRGVTSSAEGRRYDTLLAAVLLVTLLLLRASQAWVSQERSASATQQDGVLPVRGLRIGVVAALVISLAAAGAVQSTAFTGQPTTPARIPPLNQTEPLSPVSFISGLRPTNPKTPGTPLFSVTFDRDTTSYVSIASVDSYDGSGWTFDRTFRPSGGVIPAEDDPSLRPSTRPVTQDYTIDAGPMTEAPWMPYLHRAARVSGISVNIDPTSGMIVPAQRLRAGSSYSVQSDTAQTLFSDLPANALPSLSGAATDIQLPEVVNAQLTALISSLQVETGVSSTQIIPFLQAVARQFRTKDALSGAQPTGPAGASPTAAPTTASPRTTPAKRSTSAKRSTPAKHSATTKPAHRTSATTKPRRFADPVQAAPSTARRPTPARTTPTPAASPSPSPSTSASGRSQVGGNGFADVLASIRQNRSATPEQYATLMTLIARKLNVRARLVSGFRIMPPNGSVTLPRGRYVVTTQEAWTWVEIPITNVGWVVLDPSPSKNSGKDLGGASAVPTKSQNPTPSNSVELSKPNARSQAAAPTSTVPHSSGTSPWSIVVLVAIVVAAVLVVLLLALLLRKWIRVRRRRSSGDPRRRLIGAWLEGLDMLVESGLPDVDHLTSAEVSAATAEQFGGEPGAQARYLGDAANAAIFAPTSYIGPAEADAAWQAQSVLRKSVRRRLTWRARIGATLRYHRPARSRSLAGPASWEAAARARSDRDPARRSRRGRTGRHSSPPRTGPRRAR